jgi:hypothetical protein
MKEVIVEIANTDVSDKRMHATRHDETDRGQIRTQDF